MSRKRKLPPIETLKADYESGKLLKEIAERYGVVISAVYYALKRAGVPRRTRPASNTSLATVRTSKAISNTYQRAHYKVRKIRGKPSLCEQCGTTTAKRFDWANISGNYDDPSDYIRLCKKCHYKHDGALVNVTGRYSAQHARHDWKP